jgi:hypothetical protein
MKNWTVRFHSLVETDLKLLGSAEAKRVLKVIRERIAEGGGSSETAGYVFDRLIGG